MSERGIQQTAWRGYRERPIPGCCSRRGTRYLLSGALAFGAACHFDEVAEPAPLEAVEPVGAVPSSELAAEGLLGVVLAAEQVELVAIHDGRLASLAFGVGDQVKEGSLVAEVDSQLLRHDFTIAMAELSLARAELARAELQASESRRNLAQRRAQFDGQVISADELAAAEFAESRAAGPDLDISGARVQAQAARVAQLEQRLRETKILAPISGTIAARHLDVGAVLTAGTPIVRLLADGGQWVRFAIPSSRQGSVTRNSAVSIRIEGLVEQYAGVVMRVAPEVDAASRMIFAEARFTEALPLAASQVIAGNVVHVFVADAAVPATGSGS